MAQVTIDSWSSQQLAEFLAGISTYADEPTAVRGALERAADALEAEVAALVCDGKLVASLGFPPGAAPDEDLGALAPAPPEDPVELPGVGRCRAVSVPFDGTPPGWLLVARVGDDRFTAEEIGLLRGMARVLALGLQSLAAVAALRDRQAVLERLIARQRQIVRRADANRILHDIVGDVAELLGDEMVCARLLDPGDPGWSVITASRGFEDDELERIRRVPLTRGLAGQAIASERLVVMNDYRNEVDGTSRATHPRVRAAMAAPIHEDGVAVGGLVVASPRAGRAYTQAEQEALTAFAELASVALTDLRIVERAVHRACHDALTGLPNRVRFADRLADELERSEREGRQTAVLFLDLDRFKTVNDSLGHAAGDELLIAVALRLRGCIRPTDLAARFGGDEFAVLLEGVGSAAQAERVALRVLTALEAPFSVAGREVFVSASIGIAAGVGGGDDLLRNADLAMYRAKADGKGCFRLFEPEMHSAVVERLGLEGDLKRALQRGELALDFQPIVDLGDARVLGLEALLRWRHPTRGLVPPCAFIPLAEELGLMPRLGMWVLEEGCRQAAAWRSGADGEPLGVSVNLSAQQLQTAELVSDVARALRRSALEPGRLTLEITETMLMGDMALTLGRLARLKALGVRLALDDFGTGYSSLQYLRRFPIDVLKVDKAFVDEITPEQEAPLTSTIIDLGHRLGLEVVAEGVERADQHERLVAMGCRRGQGFLFARPMAADRVGAFLGAVAPSRSS